MKQTKVVLPHDMHACLMKQAAAECSSVAAIIRQAIRNHLAARGIHLEPYQEKRGRPEKETSK